MAQHVCNYFCDPPVHAVNLLIKLRTPYECLAADVQAMLRDSLVVELQSTQQGSGIPVESVERLIPVRDLSVYDFYQQNPGWSTEGLREKELQGYYPYVALVHYGEEEVTDAVS